MNKVILMGRFTRDPEIRYSQADDQMAIAKFSLAVDRRYCGDNKTADFINCIAFRKTAEFIEKYFRKGMKAVIEGRIQTGSYNKDDGTKVYTTDVIVEQIEFAESKSSSGNPTNTENSSSVGDGFMNVPEGIEEELPFN